MTVTVIASDMRNGWGLRGDTYLIPVKGFDMKRLPLPMIEHFCRAFVQFARVNSGASFTVTVISGGYKPPQIAPFFDHAPMNVQLPYQFQY